MDVFKYLPQLVVAYDGNDEFANLIHVKKADKNKNYFCPCCGAAVRPWILDNNKEQPCYCHKTEKCTKESQVHFFYKNWLFGTGNKFYIDGQLFETSSVDIGKKWITKFGDYQPDITVYTTSGQTIYFEIFFSNRKTGNDYFCIWDSLGNDVVEVNIKEYMYKTDKNDIPVFTYLYHDGKCYSKTYVKKDLYANTVAKIKHRLSRQKILNYKYRIEQLDWFWQTIRNNGTKEEILSTIAVMDYEDMLSCYGIIKKIHCVSCLKNDVLNIINKKVIQDINHSLNLPYDENIHFDLVHLHGRTYEAGIRLDIKTPHIVFNGFYRRCKHPGYPRIVFSKNVYDASEISIPKSEMNELENIFRKTARYKQHLLKYENVLAAFEGNQYKIRVKNNFYTVLAKIYGDNFEPVLDGYFMETLDIKYVSNIIQLKIKEIKDKKFLEEFTGSEDYHALVSIIENYKDMRCKLDTIYKENGHAQQKPGIYINLWLYGGYIYNRLLNPDEDSYTNIEEECKNEIDGFIESHNFIINLVSKINNCKNSFWKAELFFDYGKNLVIKTDQTYIGKDIPHITYEKTILSDFDKETVIFNIKESLKKVMKNMEKYGYRIMEGQQDGK
ncbi:MAG: hypothetical protein HFH68_00290 [Lachnospiraceae bacterium]|nr:hypothetical protein [Lachnospiraceae bacterium]